MKQIHLIIQLIIFSWMALPSFAQIKIDLHYSVSDAVYYSDTRAYRIENRLMIPKRVLLMESRDARIHVSRVNDTVCNITLHTTEPGKRLEVIMYDTLFKDTLRYELYAKEFTFSRNIFIGDLKSGDEIRKDDLMRQLKKGIRLSYAAELNATEIKKLEKLAGNTIKRYDVVIGDPAVAKEIFFSGAYRINDAHIEKLMSLEAPFVFTLTSIRVIQGDGTEVRVAPVTISVVK